MLRGSVIDREDNQITLMVGGVGHEVLCTLNALSQLAHKDAEISLWTHLIVREDIMQLYGFSDKSERALFRELIRISGIGPKVALAILSGMDAQGLIRAIHQGDAQVLTRLPGIGKKTAERLVVEMSDRLADWDIAADITEVQSSTERDQIAEAEQALISLGYKPVEAAKMLSSLDDMENASVEKLVRAALQSRLAIK